MGVESDDTPLLAKPGAVSVEVAYAAARRKLADEPARLAALQAARSVASRARATLGETKDSYFCSVGMRESPSFQRHLGRSARHPAASPRRALGRSARHPAASPRRALGRIRAAPRRDASSSARS